MSKFKVGDIARGTRGKYSYTNEGMTRGEVVETFEPRGTSNDDMRVKILTAPHYVGCTFPVESKHFELVKPVKEFIVIRRDDRDVIASHKRGDKIVKTAKATCAPSDEFDFETGAKLAFDRLMGREEPKPQPSPRFKVGDAVRLTPYYEARDHMSIHEWNWTPLVGKVCHISMIKGKDAKLKESALPLLFPMSEFSPAPEPKYYSGKVRATGVRGAALERGRDEYTTIYYDRVGVIFEFKNGDCPELGMRSTKNFDEIVKVLDCSTWQEVTE